PASLHLIAPQVARVTTPLKYDVFGFRETVPPWSSAPGTAMSHSLPPRPLRRLVPRTCTLPRPDERGPAATDEAATGGRVQPEPPARRRYVSAYSPALQVLRAQLLRRLGREQARGDVVDRLGAVIACGGHAVRGARVGDEHRRGEPRIA